MLDLSLPLSTASRYKSASQQARVMTEAWFRDNMYCPSCSSNTLEEKPPNTKVFDFLCDKCEARYQLKAQSKPFRKRVMDSAYTHMKKAVITFFREFQEHP